MASPANSAVLWQLPDEGSSAWPDLAWPGLSIVSRRCLVASTVASFKAPPVKILNLRIHRSDVWHDGLSNSQKHVTNDRNAPITVPT